MEEIKKEKIELITNLYEIYLTGNNSNTINVFSVEIIPSKYKNNINEIYQIHQHEIKNYYDPHIFLSGKIFCPIPKVLNEWNYEGFFKSEKINIKIKREFNNLDNIEKNIVINILEKIFYNVFITNPNITLNVFNFGGKNFFINEPNTFIDERNNYESYFLFIGYNLKILKMNNKFYFLINTLKKYISSRNLYYELKNIKIQNSKDNKFDYLSYVNDFYSNKIVLFKIGSLTEFKIKTINKEKDISNFNIPIKKINGNFIFLKLNEFSFNFGYNFKFQTQPIICVNEIHNEENTFYIPSELLFIEEEENKNFNNLNIDEEKNILKKFTNFIYEEGKKKELKNSPYQLIKEWGLGIGKEEKIKGKIYSPVKIKFYDEERFVVKERIKNRKAILPINFKENEWIFIIHKRNYLEFNNIFLKLENASKTFGINLLEPSVIIIYKENEESILEEIKLIEIKSEIKIIFICFNFIKYKKLEKYLSNYYTYKGIMFQLLEISNYKEQPNIFFENHISKIIAKNGGEIFNIKMGKIFLNCDIDNYYMIIGIFIPDNLYRKTIICSSSYDNNFCHYYTEFKNIEKEEEIPFFLFYLIDKSIKNYKNKNNRNPNNIILYFKCQSEEDFMKIRNYNLNEINNNLNKDNINLCFITVHKNTDFQFFRTTRLKIKNPKIGTLIQGFIPSDLYIFKFFLQSKYTKEKKLKITEYRCLINKINLTPRKIQHLTFKLCFLYWFKNRGINVPTPIKYAQVCFNFIYKNQIENVNEKICDYPYFS